MRKNTKKLTWSVLVAIIVAVLALIHASGPLWIAMIMFMGGVSGELLFLAVLLAIYGLALLAVAVGVAVALCQRKEELDRGEEDEAKKY